VRTFIGDFNYEEVHRGLMDICFECRDAHELAHLGITANVVNPGPTDTGWMHDEQGQHAASATPLKRPATPEDAANIIRFLCSPAGGRINSQLLYSNGAIRSTIS
jgi:3-oxoacyl-[acyl-carrier protein] reductase